MTLTLEQIAKLAGISRTTASRVINGHPCVRPAVRERVWQVIREHGYQPDPVARSLASRRSPPSETAPPGESSGEAPAAPVKQVQ